MVEVASSSLVVRSIFWRHSQAVRQRTATPSPPVRFWVTPPKTGRSFMICRSFVLFGIPVCCDGAEKYKLASNPFAFKISFRHLRHGIPVELHHRRKDRAGSLSFGTRQGGEHRAGWLFMGLFGAIRGGHCCRNRLCGTPVGLDRLVLRELQADLRVVRPKWRLRTILYSCINGSSEVVSILAFSVGIECSDGVASLSIIWYAQGLFGRLFRGYINGVSPVVSYHFGRDDKRRLSRLFRISVVTLTVTVAVVTALSYFLVELSFIFAKGSIAVAKSPFLVSESLRPAF